MKTSLLCLMLVVPLSAWPQAVKSTNPLAPVYVKVQKLLQASQAAQALKTVGAALLRYPNDALLHNLKGLAAMELGRQAEAESSFRKVIQLAPNAPGGYTNLAILLSRTGHGSEAQELFQKALKHDPHSFNALLGLGALFLSTSNYTRAARYLKGAWEAKPDNFQAGYEYAFALGKLSRAEEAEKVLKKLPPPTSPALSAKFFALRATLAADRKDWATASRLYADAYRLAPNSFEIYSSMVAATLQAQQVSERHVALRPPANLTASQHYQLGLLFASGRAYSHAISEFRETLRLEPSNESAMFDLILSYQGAGEIRDAINECQTLLKRNPKAKFYATLASLEEVAGEYQGTITSYQKAISLDPDNEEYYFKLGSECLSHSAYEQALTVFEEGSKKFTGSSQQFLGLGLTYYALRKYPESAEALLRALEIDPSSHTAYSAWNSTASFLGPAEWGKMLPRLERLAKAHPENANVLYCYGVTLFRHQLASGQSKDFKQAQSVLGQALRLKPRFSAAHLALGNLYLAAKQGQRAVGEFREALKSDPESLEAHYHLAQAYRSVGQVESAKQELNRYEDLYYYELGSEYLTRSAPKQALKEFQEGSKKFPGSAQQFLGMGLAYYALRKYPESAEALLRALAIDPSSESIYSAWNSTASSLGSADWGKVMPRLERLAKAHPENAEVLYCYGVSLLYSQLASKTGTDFGRVKSLLEQAIRLKPQFFEAQLALGNLYMAEKQEQSAIKEFRKVLQLNPRSFNAHYRLAQAYRSAGMSIAAEQEMAICRELSVYRPKRIKESGHGDVVGGAQGLESLLPPQPKN